MKKLNKLCAILFAVLGVTTLKAQTDVTSTYLTNADFASVDGWTAYVSGDYRDYGKLNIGGKLASYAASTSDATHLNTEYCLGFQCRWSPNYASYNQETTELPAGVYTLSYDVENVNGSTTAAAYNNLFYVKVGDRTFTDTSTEWMKGKSSWTTHSITFVITEPTQATISLGYGTGSNNFATTNTPVLYVSHLNLTHRNIDDISAENPADLTSYIVNNSFETGNSNGWTYKASSDTGVKPNSNGTYTTSGVDGNYLYNTWWQGTPLTQTVANLPNGIYQLNVLVASGDGDGSTPDIYLLANGEHSEVYTISDGNNKVFHDVSYEFKVLNGQATIGVVGGNDDGTYNADGHWWYKADNFRLTYKGIDLSIIKEAYETALANATAARDNSEYTNVVGVERTNILNAISLQPAENKSELEAATTALLNATTAFTASKPDYDALAAEKEIAAGLGMSEESIASAAATTKTGLVALQDLKVAEYNYIQATYTENATLGSWTETFAEDLNGEGYKTNGSTYFNEWGNATRTAKQTVKLPAGDYAISGIGRGQVGTSGYLYYKIGEETTQVDFIMKGNRGRGVDVNGVANFSEEGEYNCNGEGFGWEYRFITFHLDAETEVEIGVSATFANAWVSIYAPVLLTTESSVKVLRMTEITNLLGIVPTGKMNATVQSTLDEKKDAAEAASAEENTIDELSTIATELNEAIIAANASIAEYEKIATYIAKANTIDESIAADVQTQYDNGTLDKAEPVFQALEVATYNYVTENFNYNVALSSDWNKEGPVGELSDQHWSGEKRPYMEQSSAAWGWDAWSISYDQDLTLPAGKYVFKVAGRKAAGNGCTLELIVTKGGETLGTVNDFPEGDQGYGIDTSGAANFSEEGTYANNDNGRGWQWRYVKFTLASEATVNIAVNAEATTNHQWISFCDATVQMTEETYLEANKGGLDAPTAAAEALVDTKPMGTAENDALKAALALPVTTGAELLAKIDALNAAVANANTWIANYNTTKAPLVAALERFETDYNDAENGALDYMCKSRWTTAVNMAQAAALAKDVTDSYEGFATATENLVAALDAATVSIGEYSNLKVAIDAAGTLYDSANWGDEPFQKPESAKDGLNTAKVEAQDAYDAAEVDGDDVTAVIESLNNTVNGIVLNAPEKGQRFNIVMDFEGWEHHGKAATYLANDRNDAGNYNIKYYAAPNVNYAQAFTFTAVAGQPNCYTLSMTDVDNNERYVCTGTVYGGNASQIRTTTDASKALAVKVIATATEGIHQLWNTEANNYIGGQDAGFFTVNSHTNFRLQEAEKATVTLNVSSAGWATLILPFNAEIPEGVKAYTSVALGDESVELIQVSEGGIKANTPYLIKGTGEYNFSGYGLADKDSYEDENGLFVGTYVDYATTGGEYVLQNHDGKLGFYFVGESTKPTVKAYRCYLTAPASGIKAFFFFDDDATGINGVDAADIEIEAIYTINGAKVNSLQKGLNIVKMSNGKVKKVFVK